MAEQLANNYSTTLAAGYTAGAGAILVTSATGAPGSGTFSVTILDATTGNVKLIFRVTSVAGTTFTGASEGPDANASAADIVVGTMLTAAALTQLFADHAGGGGGFIQALTAPDHTLFTQLNFNVGSGVTTTEVDLTTPATAITIHQQDPTFTTNLAALVKNKLAATFTVTVAVVFTGDVLCRFVAGLVLYDGTAKTIFFGGKFPSSMPFICVLTSLANTGSISTSYDPGNNASPVPNGALLWLRVQETASARNYYVSADGQTFSLIKTEGNTTDFTTLQYGLGIAAAGSGATGDMQITCYSFAESNP